MAQRQRRERERLAHKATRDKQEKVLRQREEEVRKEREGLFLAFNQPKGGRGVFFQVGWNSQVEISPSKELQCVVCCRTISGTDQILCLTCTCSTCTCM